MKKLVHDNRDHDCQPLCKPDANQETNTVKEVELPERETETKETTQKPPSHEGSEKNTPEVVELRERQAETKETGKKCPSHVRRASPAIKEIRSTEIVRSEKFLGSGTFGSCYLAHYRGYIVTVKEFKVKEKTSLDDVKKEVRHEATMISHLGDHPCLPLLFGIVTRSEPLRLIIQFHGEKDKSLTLSHAMRKNALTKPSWLRILKEIAKGLSHIHRRGILHNDLKANNVVLEKRKEYNPVIIDFGKSRFTSDPKQVMSLSVSSQAAYRKRYPHIAPEIVCGKGIQSVASDIFSFGKIALDVLDLLPTATAESLKAAKLACSDNPEKRPSIKELCATL